MIRLFIAIIIVTLGSSAAVAQVQPASAKATEARPVAVQFFALEHGAPVAALHEADISIQDEGQPAPAIKLYRGAELPLRLGVLVDTSSAQEQSPVFIGAVQALGDFLMQMTKGDQDKLFFEKFSATPDASDFMDRRQLARYNVNLTFGPGTALYDAIVLACQERIAKDAANPARRVLVVVTNGADSSSRANLEAAIHAAEKAGVSIFTVSTNGTRVHRKGDAVLDTIADSTGGQFFQEDARDMAKVFSRIGEQINGMYVALYTSGARDEKFHSVRVRQSAGKKLEMRAAKRYFSAAP
ncbi:MAG: VWA domain-containing protein [Terriglobales bacterium]